jgi:hypothetical protein
MLRERERERERARIAGARKKRGSTGFGAPRREHGLLTSICGLLDETITAQ